MKTIKFSLDRADTIVHAGQFTAEWEGRMVDHMEFGPLHVEADETVAVDWVKRTARVVKKEAPCNE